MCEEYEIHITDIKRRKYLPKLVHQKKDKIDIFSNKKQCFQTPFIVYYFSI